jgi:hypothetical protein
VFNQVSVTESIMAVSDPFGATSASLLAKTGCDLPGWVTRARALGIEKHKALVDHLKAEHGLGHGHANTIALKARESDAGSIGEDALTAAMFAGPKAHWQPLYDRMIAIAASFGGDVEQAPKKGYMSLRRTKQFAILQPSTKDRFDLGLALKGEPVEGRLEAAGSWNAMVSHRVRIATADEFDQAVIGWLRVAYDRA